ncbi:hypothetical protein NX059_000787 [Plenodomus lindquistii]|nr:hypothetical protein NX059_000787 [Plenodomus lindquistii]
MSFSPVVLSPLTLPGLLDYILTTQSNTAPTTLIVCSSRDAFLEDLLEALQHDQTDQHQRKNSLDDLVTPTLFNLFTTQHVKLAFCPSVQALLAYLTACGRSATAPVGATEDRERLVLVSPLAMHAPTTSFSAQGLSRTFAAATEAALHSGAMLIIVECQGKRRRAEEHEDEDALMDQGDEQIRTETGTGDPWEQEVSILNVSARRYGSGSSDRAWAGRTVSARRIAERWFRFLELDDKQSGGTAVR